MQTERTQNRFHAHETDVLLLFATSPKHSVAKEMQISQMQWQSVYGTQTI